MIEDERQVCQQVSWTVQLCQATDSWQVHLAQHGHY